MAVVDSSAFYGKPSPDAQIDECHDNQQHDDGAEEPACVIASVQLTELEMLSSNPAYFTDAFQWRIRMEALEELPDPVSVAFYWVGSTRSDQHDQLLDEFEIGPLTLGVNEVVLDHPAPEIGLIPADELFEITGMYIVLSYRGEPFLRVGYYARVAFWDDRHMQEPPANLTVDLIGRSVNMERPMVTTYAVDWDSFSVPATATTASS